MAKYETKLNLIETEIAIKFIKCSIYFANFTQ